MTAAFNPPHPVQPQGSRLARSLLTALGWELQFEGLSTLQGVFVVYPHTSNWDFVFAVMAKWALGVQLNFWGKDTLFRVPLLGRWLRWLGGIPVTREKASNLVAASVAALQASAGPLHLVVPPEGTRGKTSYWKTGFYYIAVGAQVPIVMAYMDYSRKVGGLGPVFEPSGDIEADMVRIKAFYAPFKGKNADQFHAGP